MAVTVTLNPSGQNVQRVVLTDATTLNILAGYDGQTFEHPVSSRTTQEAMS